MAFRNSVLPNDAAVITPSDTAFVDLVGVFCGGTGTLTVITGAGNSVLFTGVLAGQVINLRITKVMSTGTTATNIVGLKA